MYLFLQFIPPNALKNKKVTAIFPVYGDFYETDRNHLQKSDSVLEVNFGLLYKKVNDDTKIKSILIRDTFPFLENYANQYLSDYEQIKIPFNIKLVSDKEEKSRIFPNGYKIRALYDFSSNKKKYKHLLDMKLETEIDEYKI